MTPKVIHEAELRYHVEGHEPSDDSWSFLCARETQEGAMSAADLRAGSWKKVRVVDTHTNEDREKES